MRHPNILIRPETSIREAMARIDAQSTQLAVVVDATGRLLGTVSDGDVRRGLLGGLNLESAVERCMNPSPLTLPATASRAEIIAAMKARGVRQTPLVNADGQIVELVLLEDLTVAPTRNNAVVLMVGGMGTRLGPLTRDTPKPMLRIGDKPLLEHILHSFQEQGFYRFWFAVNYLGDIIKDHFGDGSRFNCEIHYLHEEKRMGTAGALSLLPTPPSEPFIVSNGDLLARLDMGALLERHDQAKAEATMAVREYDVQVPFGVVNVEDGMMTSFEEKPVHRHMICSGVYALSPQVLSKVPQNTFFDMPQLFQRIVDTGGRAAVHRFDGYWLDIGRRSDYDQAIKDFQDAVLS